MFKLHAPPWGQSTLTGKNRKRGFSLTELVVVILIVSIVSATAFVGSTVIVKKAKKAKVESDLYAFQSSIEAVLTVYNEQPGSSLLSNKERLENVMFALNDELLPSCVLSSISDTLFSGGIQKTISTEPSTDFLICESQKRDPWGHPYYVIIDQQSRVNDGSVPELFVTVVTAGPNGILNLDGEINEDDMFLLTSNINGKITSEIYIASDAVPTIADGSAPATSYVTPLSAPVNNGITFDDLVFGGSEPAVDPGVSTFYIAVTVTNGAYSAPPTIDKNSSASVTITPNSGYSLPNFVSVIGATSSYNSSTGVISLSNPTGNVSITTACPPNAFAISTTVTNGSYTGATSINASGNASVTISASSGYMLPASVTVTGATHTYNSSTGVVSLSNPTGNVEITASCPLISYISFTSPSNFTLRTNNNTKNWDGTLEYSFDGIEWSTWNGTATPANTTIMIRGLDNSYIAGEANKKWVIDGSDVSCSGNIETLLDYQEVANGEHPTMADSCYAVMFAGCTALTTASALPATTLASECYASMFAGCTALTSAPALPATTLEYCCYARMFEGCTSLTTAPALPATTLADYCYRSMFFDCTALTSAPALPAMTMASYCYELMFSGCTSLTTAPVLPVTTLAESCYNSMFSGCTNLVSAPALPATMLATYCYQYMFKGCTALTSAPALPATTLADSCYHSMFKDCTSLDSAPELPATTLADSCYQRMFRGCTSLDSASALPATTLADYCYSEMFRDCTSLTSAPALPATTLATNCYYYMFHGCSSLMFSATRTGIYQYEYRVPMVGTGTTGSGSVSSMFASTGGTFTGTPEINTTYYTTQPVVGAPTSYSISTTVTNGSYTGDSLIYEGGNASVTISANSGYNRPASVTVTGAEYTYNSSTGVVSLSNPTGNVTITASCPVISYTISATVTNGSPFGATEIYANNNASVAILPNFGYERPASVTVTGATHTYNSSTGVISLSNPTGNVTITASCPVASYAISTTVTNGTYIGATSINPSGNASVIISASSGYRLPISVTVIGATHTYNSSTGVISLSEPTGNVEIMASCPQASGNFISFNSSNSFTLKANSGKRWNGTLEWSDGVEAWATWDGSQIETTTGTLNVRGTGNTIITGNSSSYKLILTGTNISCAGNIETLLDYATVVSGDHPAMASYCFAYMFQSCTSLTSAPALPATTLATYCYSNMFNGCTSLTTVPALPATTMRNYCYYHMFYGCTTLTTAPALPATTLADSCYCGMFYGCTSLVSAPVLPATTLTEGCYFWMFRDCTALTTAPVLPATTLTASCYYGMFQGCTALATAPALPATTLATNCYLSMFQGCTSLVSAPALPATTLTDRCYEDMFNGCTSLKFSVQKIDEYQYPYRIPTTGYGSGPSATSWSTRMFSNTGGTFTSNLASINTTYYTTNPPVS